MNTDLESTKPQALLLISSGCNVCPSVLQALCDLLKEGLIASLETINLSIVPKAATRYDARTVPWIRIGEYELEGRHSPSELRLWAERSNHDSGWSYYFTYLIENSQRHKVTEKIGQKENLINVLIDLLGNTETDFGVRLGIDAIFEDLAGSSSLKTAIGALVSLSHHPEARIRCDALHYLALTHSDEVVPALKDGTQDDDLQVRESASDALQSLLRKD
ncbi:MAG TPA: HEAT repeat domain-containing protein [Acidiferrobacteraceae bacterium]|nr:HEAT repeat domain-containing protein [Acidiferrobacteraceae bacterium]